MVTNVVTGINFLPFSDMQPRKTLHQWSEDFDFFLATSWVITLTNSSNPAIGQTKDGVLLFTNTSAANDAAFLQARDIVSGQVANHWLFTTAKRLYFGVCFKVSDPLNCNWFFGLTSTNTTPTTAVADGIYMQKTSLASGVDGFVAVGSVRSTFTAPTSSSPTAQGSSTPASNALVAAQYTVLEFYYDGVIAAIQFFKDGAAIGALPLTNITAVALSLNFGMLNVNAVANTMSVDWIEIMQERG